MYIHRTQLPVPEMVVFGNFYYSSHGTERVGDPGVLLAIHTSIVYLHKYMAEIGANFQ